jgi:hypothetical protein
MSNIIPTHCAKDGTTILGYMFNQLYKSRQETYFNKSN